MKKNSILMGLALTSLTMVPAIAKDNSQQTVGQCYGVNSCHGKGACHGKSHGCAGKNSCKGKGWIKLSKKECLEKKGEFKKA